MSLFSAFARSTASLSSSCQATKLSAWSLTYGDLLAAARLRKDGGCAEAARSACLAEADGSNAMLAIALSQRDVVDGSADRRGAAQTRPCNVREGRRSEAGLESKRLAQDCQRQGMSELVGEKHRVQ